MNENKTYEISVVCRNCGHIPMEVISSHGHTMLSPNFERFPIPKGVTVKQFLMVMTCDNCGCGGYMGLLNQPG